MCESFSIRGRKLLAVLATSFCADHESMDSGDLVHWCNMNDSGWNVSITWTTTDSTTMAYLSNPGVTRIEEEAWELTDVG